MRIFKDSEGREWTVAVNIGSIKRVRDLLKLNGESIDLLSPFSGDPPLMTRLFLDLCLLADVLYALCRPQAQERNVSDEAFGAAIAGEQAAAAYQAFFEELVDFFQKAGRDQAARMLAGNLELIQQEWESAGRAFDAIAKAAPQLLAEKATAEAQAALAKLREPPGLGGTSTSSPRSPGAASPIP